MSYRHQLGVPCPLGNESSDTIDSLSDLQVQFENSCLIDEGLIVKLPEKIQMKAEARDVSQNGMAVQPHLHSHELTGCVVPSNHDVRIRPCPGSHLLPRLSSHLTNPLWDNSETIRYGSCKLQLQCLKHRQ